MCSNYCFWQRQPAINYPVIITLLMLSIILVTLVTTWSLPSAFKLPVTGQIHAHVSPSCTSSSCFLFVHTCFFLLLLLLLRRARQQHPSHDRCWVDIKPAVFCFQARRRVSRLISRQNLALRTLPEETSSVCALLWELFQLSLLLHPDTYAPFNWLMAPQYY